MVGLMYLMLFQLFLISNTITFESLIEYVLYIQHRDKIVLESIKKIFNKAIITDSKSIICKRSTQGL